MAWVRSATGSNIDAAHSRSLLTSKAEEVRSKSRARRYTSDARVMEEDQRSAARGEAIDDRS
jgi:hypothetical protein